MSSAVSLSGFSLPALVENSFLFAVLGDKYSADNFEQDITLDDIDRHLEFELTDNEDQDSLSISDAVRYFLVAMIPDWSEDHPINKSIGTVRKYKNSDGVEVYRFVSAGIFTDKNGKPYFRMGGKAAEYTVNLTYDKTAKAWIVPGSKLSTVGLHIESSKGDYPSNVATLTGLYTPPTLGDNETDDDEVQPIKIEVWINLSLADKDERKADRGNALAAKRLEGGFYSSKLDWSACVQPPSTFGLIANLASFIAPYQTAGLVTQAAFEITEVRRVMKQKHDGGEFPEYSVKLNTSILPSELNLFALDFRNSFAGKPGIMSVSASDLGWVQLVNTAQISGQLKKALAEHHPVQLPSLEKPWALHIKGKPTQVNPPYSVWTNETTFPREVEELIAKCRNLAFWGGQDGAAIVSEAAKPKVIEKQAIELNDDDLTEIELD